MITVPTSELVGIIADTIPFACPDKELPLQRCLRIEWDGEMLHASATDSERIGWSRWHPDDDPDEDAQDDLFTEWGGTDAPWTVVIGLDDAKDAAKMFKLGAKEGHIPLTVSLEAGQLRVSRSRDTGHSAITHVMRNEMTTEHTDPRVGLDQLPDVEPAGRTAFVARFVADFAKVRPRGPLAMTFAGQTGAVRVQIGERFTGAIRPVRVAARRIAPAA